MNNQVEVIKSLKFGTELEYVNISRCQAIKALKSVIGGGHKVSMAKAPSAPKYKFIVWRVYRALVCLCGSAPHQARNNAHTTSREQITIRACSSSASGSSATSSKTSACTLSRICPVPQHGNTAATSHKHQQGAHTAPRKPKGRTMDNTQNIYFPSNKFGIKEGYYAIGDIVNLLRKYKHRPTVIQYIADMLE